MQEAAERKPAIAQATLRGRSGVKSHCGSRRKFAGGNVRLAVCDHQHNRSSRGTSLLVRESSASFACSAIWVRWDWWAPTNRAMFGLREPWPKRAIGSRRSSTESRGSRSRRFIIGQPRSDFVCTCRQNGPRDCHPRVPRWPPQLRLDGSDGSITARARIGRELRGFWRQQFFVPASPRSPLHAQQLQTCYSPRPSHWRWRAPRAYCATTTICEGRMIRVKRQQGADKAISLCWRCSARFSDWEF